MPIDAPDLLDVGVAIYERVMPFLGDPSVLASVGVVTQVKGAEHLAHRIDDVAEAALREGLSRVRFGGRLFSEESGWTVLGTEDEVLVCDPFCNTTPTFRGIREAAIALTVWRDGSLAYAVLVDLQLARVAVVDPNQSVVRSLTLSRVLPPTHPVPSSVSTAHVVWSLYKQKRRQRVPASLLSAPATLQVLDGAINAVRLIAGDTDAFVDLYGQPPYEALPYAAVVAAGGVALDLAGSPIDFKGILGRLERSRDDDRVPIVVARSRPLADEILRLVNSGT